MCAFRGGQAGRCAGEGHDVGCSILETAHRHYAGEAKQASTTQGSEISPVRAKCDAVHARAAHQTFRDVCCLPGHARSSEAWKHDTAVTATMPGHA